MTIEEINTFLLQVLHAKYGTRKEAKEAVSKIENMVIEHNLIGAQLKVSKIKNQLSEVIGYGVEQLLGKF